MYMSECQNKNEVKDRRVNHQNYNKLSPSLGCRHIIHVDMGDNITLQKQNVRVWARFK
jgi:hypothetical protein